jgi:hypothetical protein
VTLGRDFGTEVEVLAGVSRDEKLIVNPADSIGPDTVVRIAPEKTPAAAGSAKP